MSASINQLTKQIAALNPQIAALKAAGQDGGTLLDQQNQLVLSLSKLTSVSEIQTKEGVTLMTENGTPLVIASKSFNLQAVAGNDGKTQVLDPNGTNITSIVSGGDLGGSIQTRDTAIQGLKTQLDALANQFASAFNAVQATGTDQNGVAGTDFFGSTDANPTISAANISMAITDPALIAAGSDGSSGSNGNLANFQRVADHPACLRPDSQRRICKSGLSGGQPYLERQSGIERNNG